MVLLLPFAPSLNHLYPTGRDGRRFLSARGKRYHADVAQAVMLLRLEHPETLCRFGNARLKLQIQVVCPDRRRRDLSNLPKIIEDSLKEAGVFDDDSQVDFFSVERLPLIQKPGHIRVEILAATP